MSADPLAEACKLAFEVARLGVEANPPVDPPAPMRSFLYVAQLPPRAMTVAHRVIDGDPEFRQRVAAQATEARVGQAGYLWLHRPAGWEATFGALTGESAIPAPPPPPASESQRAAGAPTPVAPNAVAPNAVVPKAVTPTPSPAAPAPTSARPAPPASPDIEASKTEIESELANLRDLVDRLAAERQNVGSSVDNLETEVVERRAESSALTTQLDSVSTDLQRARNERDNALTEKEEAATRLAALEKELGEARSELSNARSQLTRFQAERGDVESDLNTAQEQLAALRGEAADFEKDRAGLRQQVDSVVAERDEAWQTMASIRTERDGLADRVRVAEQARQDLENELGDVSTKWQGLQVELAGLTDQRKAIEDELAELSQARQSTDNERRALFADLGSSLGRVEAERDLLARQLDAAHARLRGTRNALDSATVSINAELDEADQAFGDTAKASADLDAAVKDASRRLNAVESGLAENSAPVADGEDQVPAPPVAPQSPLSGEPAATETDLPTGSDFEDSDPEDPDFEDVVLFGEPAPSGAVTGFDDPLPPIAVESDPSDSEEIEAADPFSIEVPDGTDLGQPDFGLTTDVNTEPLPLQPETGSGEIGSEETRSEAAGSDGTESVGDESEAAEQASPEPGLDDVMASYGLGAEDLQTADASLPTPPPPTAPLPAPTPPATAPPVEAEVISQLADIPPPAAESKLERVQIHKIDGDPIVVARHTVSTPDVVLLLDGDPIALMGWPSLSVAERRDALVSYLGDLAAETGAASDVIFEGRIGDEADLPVSRAVRVRLTHAQVDAATALSEIVDQYPIEWPVAVITDNPALAQAAVDGGATVLDNGQLLDLFIATT